MFEETRYHFLLITHIYGDAAYLITSTIMELPILLAQLCIHLVNDGAID
jgi:hypothetical protein